MSAVIINYYELAITGFHSNHAEMWNLKRFASISVRSKEGAMTLGQRGEGTGMTEVQPAMSYPFNLNMGA